MREVSLMRMKEDEMERKLLKHELKRIQREREELEQQHVQERLVEGSILDGDDFEEDDFREKVDSWQVGDPVEMQQKQGSTVPNAERHKSADWKNSTLRNGESDSTSVDSFVEGYERSSKVHTSPNPTRSQIASRQVYPKTLPKFSGRPQDWPTFISAYEQANRSCGFNHAENLVRLQEALEGRAKDLVRNRLLLPENVPSIIEKLRKRFGNPEVLSTMLTDRVLQLVGPDSENLESVIEFGSAIEEFTQHLKASNLTDHLKNPNLMHRLVNKLPSCYAMQWMEFKRTKRSITLETFGEFMEELVDKALEATFEKVAMEESSKSKRRTAVKGYVHATDAEIQTSSCNCNKNEDFSRQSDAVQSFQSSRTERICSVCKNPGHYGRNCNQLKNQNVEDRWRTVQRLQLCPLCIYDHGNKECSSRRKCGFNQCNKRHHAVLHWEENPGPSYVTASCNNQKQCDQSVLFRMIPITLYNKSIKVDTLALIDEGSSVTLIESGLAGQLEASGEREPLEMSWTNGMSTTEDQSMKLYLEIAGLGMEDRLNLIDARTVKKLDLPKQQLEFTNIASRYTHLHGIDIKGYGMSAPKVLLGINNVHLIAPLDSRVGKPGEPVAIKCKLGWTLYGPRPGVVATVHFIGHHRCNCVECGKSDRNMNAALKEYFQLEDVGITPIRLESKEDRRAREILERTTRRVGERFESGLLWIEDDVVFPESYQMALKRSLSLDKRIARCPEIRENILKQLEEYVTKSYAHIITDQELLETPKEKTWYLPLNFVINPKKPGKVRLVWDAAARANGVSLNDKLLKGPDMTSSLPAVINAFRERPIAFGGDIKEMFHQIRVRREDRQTQRFLFNVNSNDKPTIFVMDVVIFGASCSPYISQFVKNLNAQEHKFTYPAASQAIVHKHFVDDYFDSADTIEEAIQRALEVKKVHAAGGFEIRNWVSNSDEVLQMLDVIPCETGDFIEVNKSSEVERVLVPLRQEEYLMAENCLWRLAQYDEYIDEVTILTQNQSSPKELRKSIERTSKLYNKSPVLDEFGVIRMEGRTMRAEFSSFDSRYPIILPGKHIVTRKLVENYHQRCGHGSRETVVNEIRQRFCVENLRALVKKVTQDCTWCRMQKAKPCVPRMAALPKQRMAIGAEPFSSHNYRRRNPSIFKEPKPKTPPPLESEIQSTEGTQHPNILVHRPDQPALTDTQHHNLLTPLRRRSCPKKEIQSPAQFISPWSPI
ncbi:uncharacterized protein LOC129753634 [Uranotaenia lowii]|uniref:uncharacterized protein LOC129753634 n=1 Tax=Uranotaenia lowii TaxID=190385 RepID=UPI002479EEBE|nr:uncharacterized protein LOC129753634 [Uranotaenia lowii]